MPYFRSEYLMKRPTLKAAMPGVFTVLQRRSTLRATESWSTVTDDMSTLQYLSKGLLSLYRKTVSGQRAFHSCSRVSRAISRPKVRPLMCKYFGISPSSNLLSMTVRLHCHKIAVLSGSSTPISTWCWKNPSILLAYELLASPNLKKSALAGRLVFSTFQSSQDQLGKA
jgi:hypothetical protein